MNFVNLMILNAKLSKNLWGTTLLVVCHIHNRIPPTKHTTIKTIIFYFHKCKKYVAKREFLMDFKHLEDIRKTLVRNNF